MTGYQITMPWSLETQPPARQGDAPGQPWRGGRQSASVMQWRLEEGWGQIEQALEAGRPVDRMQARWAVLFARWAAAMGLPYYGPGLEPRGAEAWLEYAREIERGSGADQPS